MSEITVTICDIAFRCLYFFDVDSGQEGIDIYHGEIHVGWSWELELPDQTEPESVANFQKELKKWLDTIKSFEIWEQLINQSKQ